jgi:hypothetical protein
MDVKRFCLRTEKRCSVFPVFDVARELMSIQRHTTTLERIDAPNGDTESSPSAGWREVAVAMHADPGYIQSHREVSK